jgi:hypothetical protein
VTSSLSRSGRRALVKKQGDEEEEDSFTFCSFFWTVLLLLLFLGTYLAYLCALNNVRTVDGAVKVSNKIHDIFW